MGVAKEIAIEAGGSVGTVEPLQVLVFEQRGNGDEPVQRKCMEWSVLGSHAEGLVEQH